MQARIRCIVVAFVVLSFTLLGGCGGGGTEPVAGQLTVLGEPVAVPAGVDPAVMQELAQALEQQLIAQGGKGISDVTGEPVYPLMRDENVLDATLAWEYNNTGDYDQNSETNIADLTPLGLHLGKTPTSGGWAAARTADGDRNDEVNISDVTPIGANFGSVVTNYVVECDEHDNDTWVPVANVAQSAGVAQAGSGVLQYFATITNGSMAARFRVSAGAEVPAEDLATLEGTGPGPADFTVFVKATPDVGPTPLAVDFSVTFIKAVGPIDVVIDFGDGSSTDSDASASGEPVQFNHTYTTENTYMAVVTATDSGAGQASASWDVVIPGGAQSLPPILDEAYWTSYNIEDGEDYGEFSAVALVDDMPVVAYIDVDDEEVMYARSTVTKPSSPSEWVKVVVEDSTDTLVNVDVVECQGVPCVVYENQSDTDIYFASADTATPTATADWTIHKPDNDGIKDPRIEDLNDNPIMLYHSFGGLRFARSTAVGELPNENTDWQTVDIQTTASQFYRQLAVVNGLPAVAYKQAPGGGEDPELCYAYADSTEPDTLANWTTVIVDDTDKNVGNDIVLLSAGGLAAIGYSSFANTGARFLRYARASSSTPGPGDWALMTVRIEAEVHHGENLGMAWYEGRPFMCYRTVYTDTTSDLSASYPNIPTPTSSGDWDNGTLDDPTGYYINEQTNALVLADGTLAVVYRTNVGLKFAYYTAP